jgi:predicted molibdopterin-dependent oxidoreductase YjgC
MNHSVGFLKPAGGPEVRLVQLTIDGQPAQAVEGQTVAAVLLAQGRRAWRQTSRRGEPRGLFCGMGVCFDCLVCVDEMPNVRACRVAVREGMNVRTGGDRGDCPRPA